MFLASSLNDKLKKTMLDMEPEKTKTCLFPYQKPPENFAVFSQHKHDPSRTFDSAQLFNLTKAEWEKNFTINKLHEKWKEKLNLNFKPSYKKIADEYIPQAAKDARQFASNLVDPDILEVKKRKWDISVNAKEPGFPDLKKRIFESTTGLNHCTVTKLKDKFMEEGVDSRNSLYAYGLKWDTSTSVSPRDLKVQNENEKNLAKINTTKHWRNTEVARQNEMQLPLSKERMKFEVPKFYKKYRTPKNEAIYNYNTMKKVKELTWLDWEKTYKKVVHDNPGNDSNPEKLISLTNKVMTPTFKEKFNELTGKNIRAKTLESFKKHWKDQELVDKISTLQNWNNIKWFKPLKTQNDYNNFEEILEKRRQLSLDSNKKANTLYSHKKEYASTMNNDTTQEKTKETTDQKLGSTIKTNFSDNDLFDRNIYNTYYWPGSYRFRTELEKERLYTDIKNQQEIERNKRELLKPLVEMGEKISREEKNIKNKLAEEYKMHLKLQLLKKRNKSYLTSRSQGYLTELEKREKLSQNLRMSKYPMNKKQYENFKSNKGENIEPEVSEENEENILNNNDFSKKHFLEAFKTVTLDYMKKKEHLRNKNNNGWVSFIYSHLGTYREFEMKEKEYTDLENNAFRYKREKFWAWSCCMDKDKNSKGCKKIKVDKRKWNLEHF